MYIFVQIDWFLQIFNNFENHIQIFIKTDKFMLIFRDLHRLTHFLADPGKARGCYTNNAVIN